MPKIFHSLSEQCFERRALAWDLSSLPMPAEILVYTRTEWDKLQQEGGRFARSLQQEVRWLLNPARRSS